MKRYIIATVILLTIIVGCKEEKKIEIIPDYNSIYLTHNLTKSPELTKGSEEELRERVKEYINQKYPAEIEKIKLDYNFLVNEQGGIDKIRIVNHLNDDVDNFVLQSISEWEFSPALQNGKSVKSQYNWQYYSGIYAQFADEKNYLVAAQVMPEIIGGIKALQEKIVYPETAKNLGIQGKVFVQAFINEQGSVTNAKVIKGLGAGCDEAALDAVKSLKFTPAMNDGKPVKVQVTIPILYKLQ